VSTKSLRRTGSLRQESPSAAEEHQERSTGPTRAQAFEAFCTLLAFATLRGAPQIFTQDALPPDAKRDGFMRWHRAARKAGIPGVRCKGKTLACTPEAWRAELPKARKLALVEPIALSVGDELDRALGIKVRRAP